MVHLENTAGVCNILKRKSLILLKSSTKCVIFVQAITGHEEIKMFFELDVGLIECIHTASKSLSNMSKASCRQKSHK